MPQEAAQGNGDDLMERAAVLTLLRKMEPGERIAFLRGRKGWTQEGLGEKLGTHKWKVHRWESGKNLPRASTRPQLAEVLGVNESDLFQ